MKSWNVFGGQTEFAEEKAGAVEGIVEELVYLVSGKLKNSSANFKMEDEEGEGDLQAEAPSDSF